MKMKQALGRSTNRHLKHPHAPRRPRMNAPSSTLLALECFVLTFYFLTLFSSPPYQGEPGTPGEKVLGKHCSGALLLFCL